jgi:hypothetical protein
MKIPVSVYRQLPADGNPVAVNKPHIISYFITSILSSLSFWPLMTVRIRAAHSAYFLRMLATVSQWMDDLIILACSAAARVRRQSK